MKYIKLIAAGALLAMVVAGWLWVQHRISTSYDAGVTAGRAAVVAEDAIAAATARQQQDVRDAASARATGALQHTLNTQLPAIQVQTHDTAETIRVVYRDRPVPTDLCSRPDSVQQALDAAVQRANAAARGRL